MVKASLRQAFWDLYCVSIAFLQGYAQRHPVQKHVPLRWIGDDRWVAPSKEKALNWAVWFQDAEHLLRALPASERLVQVLLEELNGREYLFGTPKPLQPTCEVFSLLVRYFLKDICEHSQQLVVDEQAFNDVLARVDAALFGPLRVALSGPLMYFGGPDLVDLAPGVRIERVPGSRAAELETWVSGPRLFWHMPSFSHVLRVEYAASESASYVQDAFQHAEAITQHVFAALRVLKAGHFACPYFVVEPLSWRPEDIWGRSPRREGHHTSAGSYVLEDIPTVQDLYRKIEHCIRTHEPSLDIALRRFERAIEEHTPEDKFIDLMIAAEALFLHDAQQELGYRFSQRIAAFLAAGKDRLVLQRRAKDLYDLRSQLVHGGAPNEIVRVGEQRIPFGQAVDDTEHLLRTSLLMLLALAPEARPTRVDRFWDRLLLG
jgi:hypothetical protein